MQAGFSLFLFNRVYRSYAHKRLLIF